MAPEQRQSGGSPEARRADGTPKGSGSTFVGVVEEAQRRGRERRRARRIIAAIVLSLLSIAILALVGLLATRSDVGDAEASPTGGGQDLPDTPAGSTQPSGSATTTRSPTSTEAADGPGSDTISCDDEAIDAALLESPEPQEVDGMPSCSRLFSLVPVRTASTGEELTVVLRHSDGAFETIAVVVRSACPALQREIPELDASMCPE